MIINAFCVVRTFSAGVHMGTVREQSGTAVLLQDARRLWSWSGANTLHEVAARGVDDGSRISDPVPLILLTQAIEIIPCSDAARANLSRSRWAT